MVIRKDFERAKQFILDEAASNSGAYILCLYPTIGTAYGLYDNNTLDKICGVYFLDTELLLSIRNSDNTPKTQWFLASRENGCMANLIEIGPWCRHFATGHDLKYFIRMDTQYIYENADMEPFLDIAISCLSQEDALNTIRSMVSARALTHRTYRCAFESYYYILASLAALKAGHIISDPFELTEVSDKTEIYEILLQNVSDDNTMLSDRERYSIEEEQDYNIKLAKEIVESGNCKLPRYRPETYIRLLDAELLRLRRALL